MTVECARHRSARRSVGALMHAPIGSHITRHVEPCGLDATTGRTTLKEMFRSFEALRAWCKPQGDRRRGMSDVVFAAKRACDAAMMPLDWKDVDLTKRQRAIRVR